MSARSLAAAPTVAAPAPAGMGGLPGRVAAGQPGAAPERLDPPLDPELLAALAATPPQHLPAGRVEIPTVRLGDAVLALAGEAGFAPGPLRRRLAEWCVTAGAGLMARCPCVGFALRLDRVTTDACWRWHMDAIGWRLIATLRGPATLVVTGADAERALAAQRAFDGPTVTLETGAAVLLTGTRAAGGGVVHRSPSIAGTGITRLVFVLDPILGV